MMREVWTTSGGVRLFAVEGGHGPALVFLHGGLTDHRAVLPLVEPLAARYRVITPDLRASGRSHFADSLTFAHLSYDLRMLLNELEIESAFVGGISTGSGPAVHFALSEPQRTLGLIVLQPVYAGSEEGYTPEQAAAFRGMDAIAGRAATEGVEVLREMYFSQLPVEMAERAWLIASSFDGASVAATSRFIASGAQPFESVDRLRALEAPVLIVRGDDPIHPASISDRYAESLVHANVLQAAQQDMTGVIGSFMDQIVAS